MTLAAASFDVTGSEVRTMGAADASAVLRIYQEGLDTGEASFESLAPTWEEWCEGHLAVARLVAVSSADVVGWAALSSVSDRCVYGGVAEVSVYIGESARGKGVGSLSYVGVGGRVRARGDMEFVCWAVCGERG